MNAPALVADLPDSATADTIVVAREIAVPSRLAPSIAARERGRSPRRRRRGQREADKTMHTHATDRWMVSYADFITLLFAFFVVMYAMSSVNEGRYRVLSGALSTAFSPGDGAAAGGSVLAQRGPVAAESSAASPVSGQPTAAVVPPLQAPTPVAEPPVASSPAEPQAAVAADPPIDPALRAEVAKTAERVEHMKQLATKMDAHLQALVKDGQVRVMRGARGIAIEINAAVLFDPARADLKPASFDALRSLAGVLAGFVEPLQIEGHSDDVPIATREFRSNWELSAARAASVGRFLIDQGIAPGRIGIAGYAEFRPLTGNVGIESRARNRRVTLVVLSADDARPQEGGQGGATSAPAEAEAP